MAVATMRVPTIFYAVDRFSDVVSRMTRTTAAFGQTAQAAAMRSSRAFNTAGTNMLTAGVGMAVGIGYAVNEAVKFEKAMANVSTTIDNTNPQMMKQMGDEVLAMAKRIPKPISELTDALYDVYSAGIDGKYAMTVLNQSGRLAVAGLGTAKEGVDILTSSLNAFNMSGTESENIARMVFKAVKYGKTTVSQLAESFGSSAALVKNSNVSLAEYLATTAVLTTTGMTASRAQTQVSSAVTALIKPSGTMSKIFSRLGVKDVPKWIKANGGLVSSMRIVRDEADKMGVLTSKAFGRKEGFSAMLSLLGPLNSQYNKVMNDMTYGTDTLTNAFQNQQKTTAAGFQRMKNSVTILAIKIGDELLPRINGFIDRLTPTIDGITSWMKKNDGLATTLLNITLALLILGTVAKVGAFLFYGLSKAIALVTAITEAYTFVSTLAALSNVGLGTALWGVVTATWAFVAAEIAALWPILLIVAALGLLTYAMFDSVFATDTMVSKQIGGLDKSNKAWENSTKVQSRELQKQKQLMETHNPKIVQPSFGKDLKSFVDKKRATDLANSKIVAERDVLAKKAPALKLSNVNGVMSVSGGLPISETTNESKPKNLAGKNNMYSQDIMEALKGGRGGSLNINLNDPAGMVKDVDESKLQGIPVKLTRNQGTN